MVALPGCRPHKTRSVDQSMKSPDSAGMGSIDRAIDRAIDGAIKRTLDTY